MDITSLQTYIGPSYLLPHFSIHSYYRKETRELPSSVPCFQKTFHKSCQIIWENAGCPAWIYSVKPFAVNSLFHTSCLTGKQHESSTYGLSWALVLTKISHRIQENCSISKSHLTSHVEILKTEQRGKLGKLADENITSCRPDYKKCVITEFKSCLEHMSETRNTW